MSNKHEDFEAPSKNTYGQRIEDIQKRAKAFFDRHYTDLCKYDESSEYFHEQDIVYLDVYFEIGLILGAKTAFQLGGKLEELS